MTPIVPRFALNEILPPLHVREPAADLARSINLPSQQPTSKEAGSPFLLSHYPQVQGGVYRELAEFSSLLEWGQPLSSATV